MSCALNKPCRRSSALILALLLAHTPRLQGAAEAGTRQPAAAEGASGPPALLIVEPDAAERPGAGQVVGDAFHSMPWVAMPFETWVDPLRIRLVPAWTAAREGNPAGATSCAEEGQTFDGLLERTEHARLFQRYERVASYLEQLQRLAACATERLTREQLARSLVLEGLLELHQGKSVTGFVEALSLQPTVGLPEDLGAEATAAWQRAQREATLRRNVSVPLDVAGAAPYRLLIDGLVAEGESLMLRPGRHFLQWVGPDGLGQVGAWLRLESPSGDELSSWPPPALTLPSREAVRVRLERALQPERPPGVADPALWVVLEPLLSGAGLQVLRAGGRRDLVTRLAIAPTGVKPLGVTRSLEPTRPRRGAFVLGGGLGGLALGAGAGYFTLSYLSGVDDALDPQTERLVYQLGLGAGVAAGLFAVGSGVSLWVGWQGSRGGDQTPAVGLVGAW